MGRLNPRKRQIKQLTHNRKISTALEDIRLTHKPLPERKKSCQESSKGSESSTESNADVGEDTDTEENTNHKVESAWADHIIALDQYHRAQQNLTLNTTNQLVHLRQYMVARSNGRKAMEASNLVAELSNKGPYYARILRESTKTFITDGTISPRHNRPRVKSLLENGDVDFAVTEYLKEHKFSATPNNLKAHLEKKVFPILNIPGKKTIHEGTARKWMKKKNWSYGIRKKGIYVDGHERDDVVAYRERFLKDMAILEESMIMYHDDTLEPLQNLAIESGKQRQYILVTHDESCFHANDGGTYGWAPKGEQPLRKKGPGMGIMVSEFLLDTVGRLAISKETYQAIDNPLFPREACEIFEYGHNNGYWTSEHMIKQVNKLLA